MIILQSSTEPKRNRWLIAMTVCREDLLLYFREASSRDGEGIQPLDNRPRMADSTVMDISKTPQGKYANRCS